MFDEYRVDQECSEDVLSLLRKTAGTDPEDRVTVYMRMVEILRFEMRQEEERAGRLMEEREREVYNAVKAWLSAPTDDGP